jgi:DNA-binding NtrC family response regulator
MAKDILIIDDDRIFIQNILDSFACMDCTFSLADSVNHAEILLESNHYDIILANVKMPGGNSLILKKKVKEKTPETSFLFMSGMSSDYNHLRELGEECYYKSELNDTFEYLINNG